MSKPPRRLRSRITVEGLDRTPHRVPLLRQIGSSRVRPVAAPQNRNLQNRSLRFPAPR